MIIFCFPWDLSTCTVWTGLSCLSWWSFLRPLLWPLHELHIAHSGSGQMTQSHSWGTLARGWVSWRKISLSISLLFSLPTWQRVKHQRSFWMKLLVCSCPHSQIYTTCQLYYQEACSNNVVGHLLYDPLLLPPGLEMEEYPLELRLDSELQVDTVIWWGEPGTWNWFF